MNNRRLTMTRDLPEGCNIDNKSGIVVVEKIFAVHNFLKQENLKFEIQPGNNNKIE